MDLKSGQIQLTAGEQKKLGAEIEHVYLECPGTDPLVKNVAARKQKMVVM